MSVEIENNIRQKVNEYRVEPDANVWLAVEQALDAAKRKRRLIVVRYAAAIALLLVVGSGLAWLTVSKVDTEAEGLPKPMYSSAINNATQNYDNKDTNLSKDNVNKAPAEVKAVNKIKQQSNPTRSAKQATHKQLANADMDYKNVITQQTPESKPQTEPTDMVTIQQDIVISNVAEKENSTNSEPTSKHYTDNNTVGETPFILLHHKPKNKVSIGLLFASNTSTGTYSPQSANTMQYAPSKTPIRLSDINPNFLTNDFSAEHNLPLSFGFSIRKNINQRFAVETGVMYTYLRSTFTANQTKRTQNLHYIGIPLSGIVNVTNWGSLSLYLSAGGMVERNIACQVTTTFQGKTVETENSTVNQLQWSVNTYVGLNYQFYRNLGFYLEPGWAYFFNNNSTVQSYRTQHPSTINFRAGFRVGF